MTEHRALVLALPMARSAQTSGASLRVDDVVSALQRSGHEAEVVTRLPADGRWCTAVAVSYATAGHLRGLRRRAPRTWLDAMDSWLLVNGSGVRTGMPSYAVRALRDGARLLRMPRPELVTWISAADRRSDRRTVRGQQRLVLPPATEPPALRPAGGRRAVVVGDWAYPPNRAGLDWLVRHVLPLTAAQLHVYGRNAPAGLPASVRVHGYVADAGELHRVGDVHLGPVRSGGGVKRKVLQPLLAGLPVVATTPAAHGLRAHPLLSVHDDPASFAAALDRRLAQSAPVRRPLATDLLDADDSAAVETWLRACPGC